MRFSKPLTVTLAGAALIVLPLSGAAFADDARPHPAATAKAPQPTHPAPAHAKDAKDAKDVKHQAVKHQAAKPISLKVAVNQSRVRAGASYGVTIVVKGASSGQATVTSPEGKSYRVSLSGGRATKTLTVPSRTKSGSKTVSVKVGNKVATASFTVVGARKAQHDEPRHGHK
ncbi:hypothetical protein [Nonomuraea sp. NPDC002799]